MAGSNSQALENSIRCIAVALLVLNIIWLDILGIIGASLIVCCAHGTEGLRGMACCARVLAIINTVLNAIGLITLLYFGVDMILNSEDTCRDSTLSYYNVDTSRRLSIASSGAAIVSSSVLKSAPALGITKLLVPTMVAATTKQLPPHTMMRHLWSFDTGSGLEDSGNIDWSDNWSDQEDYFDACKALLNGLSIFFLIVSLAVLLPITILQLALACKLGSFVSLGKASQGGNQPTATV